MTEQSTANAYLQTKVMSASPEELRLMLIDGALKFAIQGRDGMVANDFEQAYLGFDNCRPILLELINTIEAEHDPLLAQRVHSLYSFMFAEIFQATHEKDVERVNKVIALLEYERETWSLLMEKLVSERHNAAVNTEAVKQTAAAPNANARQPFSIQG